MAAAPMLGYDVVEGGGRLRVNEDEAARVRDIFELYLDRQSLLATATELETRGWTTKRWVSTRGREMGGRPLGKNTLFQILTNRIYLGKITYKDEIYDGEHPAISDAEIFDRAQHLQAQRPHRRGTSATATGRSSELGALRHLRLRDGPSHTVKRLSDNGGKVYRYYCCTNAQKRGWQSCPTPSVPARAGAVRGRPGQEHRAGYQSAQ